MSYITTVPDYVSGWVDRGQYVQLGNYRLWMSASGNAAPQLSTVSGTTNCWHMGRQIYYSGNIYAYAGYISPVNTSPSSFSGENYQTIGDTSEIIFVNGSEAHRAMFNIAHAYQGVFLSLEKLSANKASGSLGPTKTSAWAANNTDLTVGNLKFRVGATNMLQVSHVSTPVKLVGQAWVGYAGGHQTAQTNLTTSTTPQYLGNPGWALDGASQLGAAEICEIHDTTNGVQYRVTESLFSSNGGVNLNYHFICVEKF